MKDVTFAYPDGTMGIENVSMELPREHIVGILGKSGSGKTTTLRCLGRFVKPDSGEILLDGTDIQEMTEPEFRSKLGIIFQQLNLFPHLNVVENIKLAPKHVQNQSDEDADKEARDTLDLLGVGDLAEKYPAEISGGQAQRVAIARGLILKPEYLLLDEPTSALDIQTSRELGDWLKSLQSETTFVIVTHDIPFVQEIASTGVLLADGKVQAAGKISDITARLEQSAK